MNSCSLEEHRVHAARRTAVRRWAYNLYVQPVRRWAYSCDTCSNYVPVGITAICMTWFSSVDHSVPGTIHTINTIFDVNWNKWLRDTQKTLWEAIFYNMNRWNSQKIWIFTQTINRLWYLPSEAVKNQCNFKNGYWLLVTHKIKWKVWSAQKKVRSKVV